MNIFKLFENKYYDKNEKYWNEISKFFSAHTSKTVFSSYNNKVVMRNTLLAPLMKALLLYLSEIPDSINDKDNDFITMYRKVHLGENKIGNFCMVDEGNKTYCSQYNIKEHKISLLCNYSIINPEKRVVISDKYDEEDGGLIVWLPIIPVLLENEEISNAIKDYKGGKGIKKLVSDVTEAVCNQRKLPPDADKLFFLINDNVYRRMMNKNTVFGTFLFALTTPSMNDKSAREDDFNTLASYVPIEKNIIMGDFHWFTKLSSTPTSKVKVEELPEKFNWGMNLTEEQKLLVPNLSERYIVPQELIRICTAIKAYKNRDTRQFQNILLYGPAGSGKSKMAEAIAYAFQLPYYALNLNPNSDEVSLTGSFAPRTECDDVPVDSIISTISTNSATPTTPKTSDSGNNTFSYEEISLDPGAVYQKINGGEYDENITPEQAFNAVIEAERGTKETPNAQSTVNSKNTENTENIGNKKTDFIFTKTQLVEAVRNGGVIELQEISLVSNPGMLGMLHSLMDGENQYLTIPTTGEVIKRHPACIVVGTTNVGYAGCNPINTAFKDRFKIHICLDIPNEKMILKRVKARLPKEFPIDENDELLKRFVKAFCDICKTRKKNMEEDSATMRGLFDWIDYYSALADVISPVQSAKETLINRLSFDDEEQAEAMAILSKYF